MEIIVAAIPGIFCEPIAASWPDRFDAWLLERDPRVKVLKKEYSAGPFPIWNCWWKDPRLARSLANELELFARAHVARGEECALWFVAHSNGAVIALRTAAELVRRGWGIAGLLVAGAAMEADVEKNGLLDWNERGWLGTAVSYSSVDDEVVAGDGRAPAFFLWKIRDWIWGKLMRPYGSLGRTGWLREGEPFGASVENHATPENAPAARNGPGFLTRWLRGGHSAWLEHESQTFEEIYQQIRSVHGAQPRPSASSGDSTRSPSKGEQSLPAFTPCLPVDGRGRPPETGAPGQTERSASA